MHDSVTALSTRKIKNTSCHTELHLFILQLGALQTLRLMLSRGQQLICVAADSVCALSSDAWMAALFHSLYSVTKEVFVNNGDFSTC